MKNRTFPMTKPRLVFGGLYLDFELWWIW